MDFKDVIGMAIAGGIVLYAIKLLFTPTKPQVEVSPDEQLGRTVRRLFSMVNKED